MTTENKKGKTFGWKTKNIYEFQDWINDGIGNGTFIIIKSKHKYNMKIDWVKTKNKWIFNEEFCWRNNFILDNTTQMMIMTMMMLWIEDGNWRRDGEMERERERDKEKRERKEIGIIY